MKGFASLLGDLEAFHAEFPSSRTRLSGLYPMLPTLTCKWTMPIALLPFVSSRSSPQA